MKPDFSCSGLDEELGDVVIGGFFLYGKGKPEIGQAGDCLLQGFARVVGFVG